MDLLPPLKLITPKSGNRADECEDECRVVYPLRLSRDWKGTARFAVADGATESAFSRSWAQILARDFVGQPPDLEEDEPDGMEKWLAPRQESWNRLIPWSRIPWHGEAKTRAGALATLLGLTICRKPGPSQGLHWRAVAVGDSCMFLVRQDELFLSFPLDDAAQFDNTPALLCSNPANNGRISDEVQRIEGYCHAGDMIILASDALAAWFLAQNAAGQKPWQTLLALTQAQWEAWLQSQREAGAIQNDDTTLMIARIR